MFNFNELLSVAVKAALLAGKETLKYYNKNIEVNFKKDSSPLTQADLGSNQVIESYLDGTEIPIISEESKQLEYSKRKSWEFFWLVDPLDGTKEFINGRKEYTVNIALVQNNKPVLGVVYAPVLDIIYYASEQIGAFRVENAGQYKELEDIPILARKNLPLFNNAEEIVIVASKSHLNKDTSMFIEELKERLGGIKIDNYGSSLKLCKVAEGAAHIYPRIAPTMEWDTAASHAILSGSGCSIIQYPSLETFKYNKEELLNPCFIVYNNKYEDTIKSITLKNRS